MTTQPAGAGAGAGAGTWLTHQLGRAAETAHGARQLAAVRIGVATAWLVSLLVNFPRRAEMWSPDAPWSWQLSRESDYRSDFRESFAVLLWLDSDAWFTAFYAFAFCTGICLLLGWRTRTMSVLFAVCVIALIQRNPFLLTNGDTILRLMAIYLVFTRCGTAWSLDARRRARRGGDPGRDPVGQVLWAGLGGVLVVLTALALLEPGPLAALWVLWAVQGVWWSVRHRERTRAVLDLAVNLVHNGALLMMMCQMCLMYAATGWYKIQGEVWQDGTAVYWPMHIDLYTGWPVLSDALTSSSVVVLLLSYGTVLLQVAFPFSLLNRRAKNVMLVLLLGEHAGIGALLGIPVFSLMVIAADLMFLPTAALVWAETRAARLAGRWRPRRAPSPGPLGPGDREEPHPTAVPG